MLICRIATCLVITTATLQAAVASPVEDFYRGKTISMVCSSSAGGGYDTLSRAVARFLGKHIPGNPSVIVRNMPGAGGIVATNFIANVAPRDGLTVANVQNNTPFEPLFGTQGSQLRPDQAHLARHPLGRNRPLDRVAHLADPNPRRRPQALHDCRFVGRQLGAELLRQAAE